MEKLIALILSLVTAVTGFFSGFSFDPVDAVLSLFTGIPSSDSSISDSFIEDIGRSDVVIGRNGYGYYKNLMIMFFDKDSGVMSKYKVFSDYGLKLLGWACNCDMYVVYAGADDLHSLTELGKKIENERSEVLMAAPIALIESKPDTTPDDPFDENNVWDEESPLGGNWYLEAVKAREAWNYSSYFSPVKVGVVDSGFYTDHEELKGKISFPKKSSERRNIADFHGTFVSGIIAAEHNNGKGIAGINPAASLVCVDWESADGQNWNHTLHIFFGICRVIKAGARVVNISLGTSGNIDEYNSAVKTEMDLYGKIYSAMMSIFIGRGNDFVAVQSAGNGDPDGNPADAFYNGHFCSITENNVVSLSPRVSKRDILDRILIVGAARYSAVQGGYVQTSFSNYGKTVNISAPGSRLYGLGTADRLYDYMSGTSAAAPVVAAVASLVLSANPGLSGSEVQRIILDTADGKAIPFVEGADELGLVNAKGAVEAALNMKHKMYRLTGTVQTPEGAAQPDDLIILTVNEKTYNITAPNGKINLICEPGNGTIKIEGDYGPDTFEDIDFTLSGSDVDLGIISPSSAPPDTPADPPAEPVSPAADDSNI